MAAPSPVRQHLLELGADLIVYGPPEANIELPQLVTDEIDLEYAAIRKGCGLLDRPDRGTLEITGADRISFLNNMLTQELKDLQPHESRSSFWLNRKGRIDADLRVLALEDRLLFDLDAHSAAATVQSLDAFLIMDDAEITDCSAERHRFSLHGPTAAALLEHLTTTIAGDDPTALAPGCHCVLKLTDTDIEFIAERDDATGETGFELSMRAEHAPAVWDALLQARFDSEAAQAGTLTPLAERFRLRPIGWHAFNVARIEAGRPLFNLDFGPDSIPAETGLLEDRVSFTKGCYLGQEIVARMHSLGHPKRTLVALRLTGDAAYEADGQPRQPITGAPIRKAESDDPIGAVTSSAVSPMLGATPVCFAMVKWGVHEPGTELVVDAE
ncbi:MAG: hypothetical protein AAF138_11665, partial [Planctomycetota bacterium]